MIDHYHIGGFPRQALSRGGHGELRRRESEIDMQDHGGKSPVRGIEHIGLIVPDIEAATEFLVQVFDARVLYALVPATEDGLPPASAPSPEELERVLGTAPGMAIAAVRMLGLGSGANIELIRYHGSDQRPAARPSDIGVQHFSVCVDDVAAVGERMRAAGGQMLEGPLDLPGLEAGTGNRFWFGLAPWGTSIELLQVRSPQAYEAAGGQRRWLPAGVPRPA
jgi:catechol 2,3-dioxygenase-like lactoylglutathione lyase family enzyme